ncbi:hypothetical protein ABK040_005257 [Willaertia magna]
MPAYSPTSPSYSPSSPIKLFDLESNGITFELPSSILQFLNENINKSGLLRQRSVKHAEYHWGHVYLQTDSKIKQILLNNIYLNNLLEKFKEEYIKFKLESKSTDFQVPVITRVDTTESTLPSHISVIPSYEFQLKFFTGDASIDYLPLICDIRGKEGLFDTHVNKLNMEKEERKKFQKEKVNDFLMLKYVKKNYELFKNLPEEIINLIESFIILNIESSDLEHYFQIEFTGQVTFHPKYNTNYAFCIFLHVKSPELENIRKKYGFNSTFEFHYTIGVVNSYNYIVKDLHNNGVYSPRYDPFYRQVDSHVRSDVDDLEINPKRLKRVWTDN